jgi:Ni/Co efflux regulator RcnB
MKLFSRLLIALALLTTGSLALADQGGHDRDRRGQGHGYADHRHDGRHGDYRRHDDRRHDYRRYDTRRYDDRRYGYRDGYRRYGHHPHWVRANNDYLLVAVATGIILDIALQ